jgi:hypothetical protein
MTITRRHVLSASVLSATAAGLALQSGCSGSSLARPLAFGSLEQALADIERLGSAPRALAADAGAGAWPYAQTLVHAAQSIEFSMQGFPQAKPAWFQHTVGALAFKVFDTRGRMSHDLKEPIPGAPALPAQATVEEAVARLRASVAAFKAWKQPLAPHFAYGALDAAAYERAHAMHLANHLAMFDRSA